MFTVYQKHPGKSRFSRINEFATLELAIKPVPDATCTHYEVRKAGKVVWSNDPLPVSSRTIEYLTGDNLGIVNQIVDRQHVGQSCLSVVRHIVEKITTWQEYPRPLRRGLIRAAIDRHCHNRKTYRDVMWR